MTSLAHALPQLSVFQLGLLASFAASLGTGAGALPIFVFPTASQRTQDILQSTAAGLMLAATTLSLMVPGLEAAARRTGSPVIGSLGVALSVVLGALAVLYVHRHAPHEHFFSGREGPIPRHLKRTWLFIIAITLHNFPEGLAVGVGFGGGDLANGTTVTLAMFLQNLPEGFVVALGLRAAGYRRRFAMLTAFLTGFVETLGGLVGAAAVALAAAVLPWAMGVAAGAMLFVISHEIIPETHRNGYETEATFGVIGGFLLMVVVGAALT